MSKHKKDTRVGQIRHKSGAVIDLMFNPNDEGDRAHTFSAKVGDTQFRAATADEVSLAVKNFLDTSTKLKWIAFIEISELQPWGNSSGSFVGLEVERFYAAAKLPLEFGEAFKLSWEDNLQCGNDMERINRSSNLHRFDFAETFPVETSHVHEETKSYLLLYDEDTWQALCKMVEGIEALKSKLRELIGTPAGIKKLEHFGASLTKMIGPAKKEGR